MPKLYCVYLAYSQIEIMGQHDDLKPEYPRDLARTRIFDNKTDQMLCYAETPCPASQLIEADSEVELNEKIEQMKNNFENPKWLENNLYPYL